MAVVGPLLDEVLGRIEQPERSRGFLAVASIGMGPAVDAATPRPQEAVRVTALLTRRPPVRGEPWDRYRDSTLRQLERWSKRLEKMGLEPQALISATALRFRAAPDQLRHLQAAGDELEFLELDPVLDATALDDVPAEIELTTFATRHPGLDGTGVTVAVLDTGVDLEHPCLEVAESYSECGEPVEIPGRHGTHCAGILASRDEEFRGVAPGVRLVNVKVGRADGRLEPGELSRGFDRAAEVGADIISVSLGFNHRPLWSSGGHGWSCTRARPCLMCRSVDTAVRREAQLVVVAAGNEHARAETMRQAGDKLDTELCCPGQARKALTVGSITKRAHLPAGTSSRGPASTGASKPDVAAPGENLTSTAPVPRQLNGHPVADPARSDLFARDSGTSMATPVVARLSEVS